MCLQRRVVSDLALQTLGRSCHSGAGPVLGQRATPHLQELADTGGPLLQAPRTRVHPYLSPDMGRLRSPPTAALGHLQGEEGQACTSQSVEPLTTEGNYSRDLLRFLTVWIEATTCVLGTAGIKEGAHHAAEAAAPYADPLRPSAKILAKPASSSLKWCSPAP